jgi:preprotein translocase SecE subunit
MSRATRRQKPKRSKAKAGQRAQQAATPQALSTSTRSPQQRQQAASSGGGGASALRFTWATDIISELQKVTWPTAADTRYLTIVVLIVATAFGVFLGGVDIFFNWFIENTLLR